MTNRRHDIGIGKRLRTTHMAFSRALRLELARCGVTFGQFVHLERLWEEDGLTQSEISRRVGVETASSTTILVELEQSGFIKRIRQQNDRRRICVFLTEAGARMRDELLSCARTVNASAKDGMTDAEVDQLFDFLDRIARNLSAEYQESSKRADKDRLRS